jgi:hypothetical protein
LIYDGSATPDVDYVALPASVTIPAGAADAQLLVQAIEDSNIEGMETVAAILVGNADPVPTYTIDPARSAAKVIINDTNLPGNAFIRVTEPKDGAVYQSGDTIKIGATAIDPDGYIAHVEFYDSDKNIGSSQIEFFRAPDPGTSIFHSFEWVNATAGDHLLTVRAVDSHENPIVSAPIHIVVLSAQRVPTVSVVALDPEATELSPLVDAIDAAKFAIGRTGDLNEDLLVFFSWHGTAEYGKDYRAPDQSIRIPAGERQVTFDVVPISDELPENMETVAIRLEQPPGVSSAEPTPPRYDIPLASREAVAVIYDRTRPTQGVLELANPDDGEVYPPGTVVSLWAAAFHPTVDVKHADFFAGEQLIGSSDISWDRIEPGGLLIHQAEWKTPLPGDYLLTARAKLPDGTTLTSSPTKITVAPNANVSATLKGIERRPDGNVRLQVVGQANQTCILETSSDLIHWTAAGSVFLPDGNLSYEDDGFGQKQKFYRTRLP